MKKLAPLYLILTVGLLSLQSITAQDRDTLPPWEDPFSRADQTDVEAVFDENSLFDEENLFSDDSSFDESSLFGFTEEEAVTQQQEQPSPLELLNQEQPPLQWGGQVRSNLDSRWIWTDHPVEIDRWAQETLWDPRFSLELFLDARPDEDFRVYAMGKAHYPFDQSDQENFILHELFSDFNWNDRIYFRAGKQTINWNVAYLYSPADRLNVTAIDPSDYSADQQGPLALKVQMPMPNGNIYLYTLGEDVENPREITYAPKVEFLLGNWELGTGMILNPDLSPKGALFITGPLGKVDFFSEALIQYGSDIPQIESLSPYPVTEEREDELLLSATAGLFFRDGDRRFLTIGQYWYDAEAQSAEDWDVVGHHFAGLHLEKGFLLQPQAERSGELKLKLLWLGDFSDSSGTVSPEVEWIPMDHGSVALGGTWRYGSEDGYYRFAGPGTSLAPTELKLSLRLGYGDF